MVTDPTGDTDGLAAFGESGDAAAHRHYHRQIDHFEELLAGIVFDLEDEFQITEHRHCGQVVFDQTRYLPLHAFHFLKDVGALSQIDIRDRHEELDTFLRHYLVDWCSNGCQGSTNGVANQQTILHDSSIAARSSRRRCP